MTVAENRDLAFHEHRCEFLGNPALHSRSHLAEFGEVTAEMARDERTGGRSLAEAVDALRITRIHNVLSFFVFCRSLRQITEGLPVVEDDDAHNSGEVHGSSRPIQGLLAPYPASQSGGSRNNRLFSLIRRVLQTTPHAPSVVSTLWFLANADSIERMGSEQRASTGWTHQFLPLFFIRFIHSFFNLGTMRMDA